MDVAVRCDQGRRNMTADEGNKKRWRWMPQVVDAAGDECRFWVKVAMAAKGMNRGRENKGFRSVQDDQGSTA